MEIKIIVAPIAPAELDELAKAWFGDMIKIVVDIRRNVIAAGGELHVDAEELLIRDGCVRSDLWGANFYPGREAGARLQYTSLINIRSASGNRSQNIESGTIRDQVKSLVERLIGLS